MSENKISKALVAASEKYIEKTSLRAAVQVIPYVGGALDTLMSGAGSDIQQQRISDFLQTLDARLQKIECANDVDSSEEFYDLALAAFEGAARARSKEKRDRFASIIVNKVSRESEWSESETAARILSSLEDVHIKVLVLAAKAPECTSPFDGLKVLALKSNRSRSVGQTVPLCLSSSLRNYSEDMLRMTCSELVSKGLLRDEGVGRLDARAMEYFVATDLAFWFLSWISEGGHA